MEKTPQEILKSYGITDKTANHNYMYLYKSVLKAMDIYKTQNPEIISNSLLKLLIQDARANVDNGCELWKEHKEEINVIFKKLL